MPAAMGAARHQEELGARRGAPSSVRLAQRGRGLLGGREDAAAGSPSRAEMGALVALVLLALLVRLAGVRHGLPFVFNIDERAHFVPRAIGMFDGDLNPHDFLNSSGLIYLLLGVFWVGFRGGDRAQREYGMDPTTVFVVGRLVTVAFGTAAVALTYGTAARLAGRTAGLLAGLVAALAFLPVFYSHQSVNDVPAMALVSLALFAAAGIAVRGRRRDVLLGGLAVGLAFGTKYNALMSGLPVATACVLAALDAPDRRALVRWTLLAAGLALVAFLLTNPYSILAHGEWKAGFDKQQQLNKLPGTILGEAQTSGLKYYLWSLGWGLGYFPLAAAVAGALVLARRRPWAALLVVPAPLVLVLFEGSFTRYYARYALPAYPFLCVLAGVGAAALVLAVARAAPPVRAAVGVGVAALLLGQSLVSTLHSDRVLRRTNTLTATRAWMVDHIPAKSLIVLEPIAPVEWQNDGGRPAGKPRWTRWTRPLAVRRALRRVYRPAGAKQNFQNYVSTLTPQLLDKMAAAGACWYVSGTTQSGRAYVDPSRTPQAVKFYRSLERRATVAHQESPFGADRRTPLPFQFDTSFNWSPLAYERPGPWVKVYHLDFGRCRSAA